MIDYLRDWSFEQSIHGCVSYFESILNIDEQTIWFIKGKVEVMATFNISIDIVWGDIHTRRTISMVSHTSINSRGFSILGSPYITFNTTCIISKTQQH